MTTSSSISDFKITVRLDSARATAGLKRLQANLNTFVNTAKKAMSFDAAGVATINAKVAATEVLVQKQRKYNSVLMKTSRLLAKGVSAPISFIGSTLWNWKYAIAGIIAGFTYMVARITKVGAEVQATGITMQASVAAALSDKGFTKEQMDKISKSQLYFAQGLAKKYGLGLAETADSYAKFFAASAGSIGVKATEEMFTNLSELGVIYGLNAEKMKRAQKAFEQMASKGKINAEELKEQLGDVLPGALQIFSRAITKTGKFGEVSISKLFKLMEDGKLISAEIFPAVSAEMRRMVDDSGVLEKVLASTRVQLEKIKTNKEIFAAGAFNQFTDTLGRLLGKFNNFLSSDGVIVSVGRTIDNILLSIEERIQFIFDAFDKYQEMWDKADLKGKNELADNFVTVIGSLLGDEILSAFNGITADMLGGFANAITDVIINAVRKITGIEMLDNFSRDIGFTGWVSDFITDFSNAMDEENRIINIRNTISPNSIRDTIRNGNQYSEEFKNTGKVDRSNGFGSFGSLVITDLSGQSIVVNDLY